MKYEENYENPTVTLFRNIEAMKKRIGEARATGEKVQVNYDAANFHRDMGSPSMAEAHYNLCLAYDLSPIDRAIILNELAGVLFILGKRDEAQKAYDEVEEIYNRIAFNKQSACPPILKAIFRVLGLWPDKGE
ncbi:MAG: tetratricopeptide repeat protein [Tannerellaceae bacterium]|jgi:tetratricopeptide (TPR) repeat protein|nr:tetratricopeptide repeat protein [Tannerellaceae bacterium]